MQIKTTLLLFRWWEMDGKAILFDGHRDRRARAVSPNPYVPPLTVTAISLQSPCCTHLRYLGNAFLLKTCSPPAFLGFFCLFFNLQTCCYSNPSTLSVLRGIFISSSAAPWKHISPSLLGGWEKMTPPPHVCWSRGSTPAGQRLGGWEVMWRDPLGSEEHPKKPLQ